MTSDKIAKKLKSEGISLSSRAVRRTIRTAADAAVHLRKAEDETRILLDSIKDSPGTDIIDAANQLVSAKILNYIKDIDEMDFDDPKEMLSALESVSRSTVGIGRLKMEFTKGVKAAKKELERELTSMLLEEDPELLHRLIQSIKSIDVEYKRGRGA